MSEHAAKKPHSASTSAEGENRQGITKDVFEGFVAGNPEDIERVLRSIDTKLISYLKIWTGRQEIAEEIAQEAFLKLYEERSCLDDETKVFPWIMVTARRMAIREMKRKFHKSEFSMGDINLEEFMRSIPADQIDQMQEKQVSHILADSMSQLSAEDQELLSLKYFSRLKTHEISEILSMPMGSVGVKISRALDKLKRVMRTRGINQEDL